MNINTLKWTRQPRIALEAIPAHYKVLRSIVCASPGQGPVYIMLCFFHEGCDCCFQVRAHEVDSITLPFPGRDEVDTLTYMTVEIPGKTLFVEEFEDPKAEVNCKQRFEDLCQTLPDEKSEDFMKTYIIRHGNEAWELRSQLWL
ncbi:MAG TPA: hypothetical protein VGE59_03710 [Patescibacteria group bacterium]